MLRYIEERINSLKLEKRDKDGFIYKPADFTLAQVDSILIPAILGLEANILNPIIAPDGCGGLKFDWRLSFDNEVRLYLSSKDRDWSYVYQQISQNSIAIQNPSSDCLLFYLSQLIEN